MLPCLFVDPRLHRPWTKTKDPSNSGKLASPSADFISSTLADLPFWEASAREEMSDARQADSVLNERRQATRSGLEVLRDSASPSLTFEAGTDAVVAGLLVRGRLEQQEWDLVLPSGWAMPFWLGFQYAGARAIGADTATAISLHSAQLSFPHHWPDTAAGSAVAAAQASALKEAHYSRPHNRRPDYAALHSLGPFRSPWARLIAACQIPSVPADPTTPEVPDQYCVLRDHRLLRSLRGWLAGKKGVELPVESIRLHPNALLPVSVTALAGGTPKLHAMLCLPQEGDVEQVKTQKITGNYLKESAQPKMKEVLKPTAENRELALEDEVSLVDREEIPFDVLIPDKAEQREKARLLKRRQIRLAYRQRVKARKKGTLTPKSVPSQPDFNSFATLTDRRIIGFVHAGDQLQRLGKGQGLALLSLSALLAWATEGQYSSPVSQRNLLLFRNSTTRLYRLARIAVL